MRIGIVNDLPMVAEALRRVVALRPEHEVVWIAKDGAQAVMACARDRPDLILMDLIMPGMDGVEATRRIMAETPCSILIVTADVGMNASGVFEAMGHGALDAIDTPVLDHRHPENGAAPLLAKLDCIARRVGAGTTILPAIPSPAAMPDHVPLIAIGASAGGPGALAGVLSTLPRDFPASIVIVQHIDARFATGLAHWLSQQSPNPVRLAEAGERPAAGAVLLARGDQHLCLGHTGRLGYTSEPRAHAYRPSIDVFFASLCQHWRHAAVGVLLTGMGKDGAAGLKALRDQGHHTLAQDEATSTVYGMPKAAARLNAATEILPLARIAPRLATLVARPGPSRVASR